MTCQNPDHTSGLSVLPRLLDEDPDLRRPSSTREMARREAEALLALAEESELHSWTVDPVTLAFSPVSGPPSASWLFAARLAGIHPLDGRVVRAVVLDRVL